MFKLNEYKKSLTDEEILEDIKRVAQELNTDYISTITYKKYGKYSLTGIKGHFKTWKDVLSAANLRTYKTNSEQKMISDIEYFADLQRIATLNSKNTVLYAEYKRYGKYSCEHIFSRFQTWDNALQLAGLEPTGLAKKRISEEELFKEIERMWILLGKQPTSTHIVKNKISKFGIDTYKRRFGSYRKALEAFIEYINKKDENISTNLNQISDSNNEVQIKKYPAQENQKRPKHKVHRTPRIANLRLRFKVMQRDKFSCVLCGTSPAKKQNVELHIDHIIPWAKGGETELDNLQTLCSNCNQGKSDLDM